MVAWQKMKTLKTSESSDLQMYLPFETMSQAESDAATKFEHFEDVDLMELIYDLKPLKWPEDERLLHAAQRELNGGGRGTKKSTDNDELNRRNQAKRSTR